MPALEERGPEMHVVEMQPVVAEGHVDTLATARFARFPREVVVRVVKDRVAAEHDVAEETAAKMARRRHHPAHPQQRPEFFGMARRVRAGADDLLEAMRSGSIARITSAIRAGSVRPSRPRQRWML